MKPGISISIIMCIIFLTISCTNEAERISESEKRLRNEVKSAAPDLEQIGWLMKDEGSNALKVFVQEKKLNLLKLVFDKNYLKLKELFPWNQVVVNKAIELCSQDLVKLLLEYKFPITFDPSNKDYSMKIADEVIAWSKSEDRKNKCRELTGYLKEVMVQQKDSLLAEFSAVINNNPPYGEKVKAILRDAEFTFGVTFKNSLIYTLVREEKFTILDYIHGSESLVSFIENNENLLFVAVRAGSPASVEWLLKNNIDSEQANSEGKTALHIAQAALSDPDKASLKDNYEKILKLYAAYDNCDQIKSRLNSVMVHGKKTPSAVLDNLVSRLKKHNCSFSEHESTGYHFAFLPMAVEQDHDELVKYILSWGIKPVYLGYHPSGDYKQQGILTDYVQNNNLTMLKYVTENCYNGQIDEQMDLAFDRALFIAVSEQKIDMIRYLLEMGAAPSRDFAHTTEMDARHEMAISLNAPSRYEKGRTALFIAMENNKIEIAKLLIEYGADPNEVYTEYEVTCITRDPENKLDDHTYMEQNYQSVSLNKTVKSETRVMDWIKGQVQPGFLANAQDNDYKTRLAVNSIIAIKSAMNKKDLPALAAALAGIKEYNYCTPDAALIRNGYYTIATANFLEKDFTGAANNYQKAITYAESNISRQTAPAELMKLDLGKWKDEGEANAPGYYCAFNAACAYAHSGDLDNGFAWLAVALKIKPALKKIALSDADLQALRDEKERFNAIVK